jgi:uncharacterized protein (TIGR02246 family)
MSGTVSRMHAPRFLALALLLCACAAPSHVREDKAAVEARLQHYSALLLAMDARGIAAMFTPDGEMVNPRQPAVRGREAIERFIAGFSDFRVISNDETPASIVIDGNTAEQMGTYHQKVRTPSGTVLEVSGRFEIEWVRATSGDWLLLQVATFPEK